MTAQNLSAITTESEVLTVTDSTNSRKKKRNRNKKIQKSASLTQVEEHFEDSSQEVGDVEDSLSTCIQSEASIDDTSRTNTSSDLPEQMTREVCRDKKPPATQEADQEESVVSTREDQESVVSTRESKDLIALSVTSSIDPSDDDLLLSDPSEKNKNTFSLTQKTHSLPGSSESKNSKRIKRRKAAKNNNSGVKQKSCSSDKSVSDPTTDVVPDPTESRDQTESSFAAGEHETDSIQDESSRPHFEEDLGVKSTTTKEETLKKMLETLGCFSTGVVGGCDANPLFKSLIEDKLREALLLADKAGALTKSGAAKTSEKLSDSEDNRLKKSSREDEVKENGNSKLPLGSEKSSLTPKSRSTDTVSDSRSTKVKSETQESVSETHVQTTVKMKTPRLIEEVNTPPIEQKPDDRTKRKSSASSKSKKEVIKNNGERSSNASKLLEEKNTSSQILAKKNKRNKKKKDASLALESERSESQELTTSSGVLSENCEKDDRVDIKGSRLTRPHKKDDRVDAWLKKPALPMGKNKPKPASTKTLKQKTESNNQSRRPVEESQSKRTSSEEETLPVSSSKKMIEVVSSETNDVDPNFVSQKKQLKNTPLVQQVAQAIKDSYEARRSTTQLQRTILLSAADHLAAKAARSFIFMQAAAFFGRAWGSCNFDLKKFKSAVTQKCKKLQ